MSGLVKSTVKVELSSRTLEPSSSGCFPLSRISSCDKMTCVGKENTVRPACRRPDIGVAVEHGKAVAMLERVAGPCGGSGCRDVEGSFRNFLDQRRGQALPKQWTASGSTRPCHFPVDAWYPEPGRRISTARATSD